MSALSMYFCFQPEMKPLGKAEQQTCGAASGEFGLTDYLCNAPNCCLPQSLSKKHEWGCLPCTVPRACSQLAKARCVSTGYTVQHVRLLLCSIGYLEAGESLIRRIAQR